MQRAPDDPYLLRTAGEAYLAMGDAEHAAAAYERANGIDKNNVASQVRLAQVRLAAGEADRGFGDLQALAAKDSSEWQAELALYSEYMRRRDYARAMTAVDALDKKQPKSPFVANLRGGVYLAKRDLKAAQASFEKALELQPGYYAAAYNLALLDMRAGNPKAARERFDRILAKEPNNEQALLTSAQLVAVDGGTPDQVRAAIDKAITANPASVRARLALVNFELGRRDAKSALTAVQAALVAIPNDPQLTQALASAQLASGDVNQAIDTSKRLVQLQPQNPIALFRLAEAQIAVKDFKAALEAEHKALALKPDFALTRGLIAKTYLLSGRPDEAIAEARRLQKEQPTKGIGYALEGEMLAAQKKWPEAAVAYRASLAREPDPAVATRTYGALRAAGKASEATAMANKWMADHPKDAAMPLFLAETSQQAKDLTAAKSGYERVLSIDPENVVALNNLAWILSASKDPKGLEYAERAHQLAPFNPSILDTFGLALTRSGQAKRGAQLLNMAASLAPGQPDIRLHLAQALLQSGDKAGARKQLDVLTKLDKSSPIRAEAEKLLGTL
jgi:putative PEP-CTERM system TPR-repeat lipoprotein